MTTADIIPQNTRTVPSASSRTGAGNRPLGTRKEESNDSDIDFLVDFNSQASLLNQVHLRDEFQEMFGRGVDVVSSRGLSPFLSKRILSEAVPI